MTAMTTSSPIDANERARRRDWVRDPKAALARGQGFEQRTKQRDDAADDWAAWMHRKMDESGINDPVQLLPDAFARLQQLGQDHTAAAIKELKASLKGALK
jgi:hypothetical protein